MSKEVKEGQRKLTSVQKRFSEGEEENGERKVPFHACDLLWYKIILCSIDNSG